MGPRSTVPFSERRHCPGRGQRPAAPWGGGDRRLAPPRRGRPPVAIPNPMVPTTLRRRQPVSQLSLRLPPSTREVFRTETPLSRTWRAPQPRAPAFCCAGVRLQWVGGQRGSPSSSPRDGRGAGRTAPSSCSQALLPQPRELQARDPALRTGPPCCPGAEEQGSRALAGRTLRVSEGQGAHPGRAATLWPAMSTVCASDCLWDRHFQKKHLPSANDQEKGRAGGDGAGPPHFPRGLSSFRGSKSSLTREWFLPGCACLDVATSLSPRFRSCAYVRISGAGDLRRLLTARACLHLSLPP